MPKIPWYAQAEKKPPDIRDPEEHAAVKAALAALPIEHPARRAYMEGAGTIALTHLVAEHRDIVEALTEAYLSGYRRGLMGTGGYFRP